MTKLLIVAATQQEMQPFLTYWEINVLNDTGLFMSVSNENIHALITGPGMVNTAYYMGHYAHNDFSHLINVGICGAFDRNLKIGEVVNVVEDHLSEMGAEDGDDFIRYEDLGLGGTAKYKNRCSVPVDLKAVRGITVNTVHGCEETIEKARKRFSPEVESMEGAAFFRGCENLIGNCIQIRGVSNYVEKRDKSKWDIPLAIRNTNEYLIKLIEQLGK
jgi:futalosine hydrolase